MKIGNSNAERTWLAPIMPGEDDRAPEDLTSVVVFGPFEEGEHVTLSADQDFHFQAQSDQSTSKLTTSRFKLPAGVWRLVVPRMPRGNGSVYVAMLRAGTATTTGWCVRSLDRSGTVR